MAIKLVTVLKIIVTSSLLFLYFTLALNAENLKASETAAEIYSEILSPYCPGRALKDCPSSAADELKNEILTKLESGSSKDTVLNELYKKFGEQINANPRNQGFGRLAWLLPPSFFIFGILIFVIYFKLPKRTLSKEPSARDNLIASEKVDKKADLDDLIDKLL